MNSPVHRFPLVVFLSLVVFAPHSFGWGDAFTYSSGNLETVSAGRWFGWSGTGSSTISVDSTKRVIQGSSRNDAMGKLLLPRDAANNVQHWPSSVIYARFDLRVNAVPTTTDGEYFFCFTDMAGNRRGRVFVQLLSASNVALGASFASIHPASAQTGPLTLGSDHTVVAKLDTATKKVTVWLDPTSGTTSPSVSSTDSSSQFTYDAMQLRQSNQYGGVGALSIDNLIYSDTFEEVMGQVIDPTDTAVTSTPATPNNPSDNDGDGIRAGLGAAQTAGVPSILLLPTGTYNVTEANTFTDTNTHYTYATNSGSMHTLVLDGNGSTILMSSTTRPAGYSPAYCAVSAFYFHDSDHLTFRNLNIDYERASFTTATVGHVTPQTPASGYTYQWQFPVTIQGLPLFDQGDGAWDIAGLTDMDASTGLPLVNIGVRDKPGATTDFINWTPTGTVNVYSVIVRTTTSTSGYGIDTVNHLTTTMAQLESKTVVLHHPSGGMTNSTYHGLYGPPAFEMLKNSNVVFKDVTINCSTGMGIHASQCNTLAFQRVNLVPSAGRLLSTAKDGIFCTLCSGTISVDNCLLQATGDDSLNVHNTKFIRLTSTGSGLIYTGTAGDGSDPGPVPVAGDVYQFCDHDFHLAYLTSGTAFTTTLSAGSRSGSKLTMTFNAIPSGLANQDYAIKKNGYPTLSVTNTTFAGGIARGLVLSTENATVSNCTFENIAFNGIYMVAIPYGSGAQAPGCKNITVTGCEFDGCGAAPIATFAPSESNHARASEPGVFQNITITNNTIDPDSPEGINEKRLARSTTGATGEDVRLAYMQAGIFLPSVSGTNLVQGNAFGGSGPNDGFYHTVFLSHSKGITLENNLAVGMFWMRTKVFSPTPVHYDDLPSFASTPTGPSDYLNAADEAFIDGSGNPTTSDSADIGYVRQLSDIQ